ncbi:molybdenum ABC transporter substrate-binding protein [Betaproteobacteria bacterium GR16-43]|nr:molybdenum ABC transporter substrate-binding protein [Betaproteobacteria bacterium GR16-43]
MRVASTETRAATVSAISSMATRELLAELAASYRGGATVALESAGGVEVARRIRGGEAFDVIVLADEALAALESDGHVVRGSVVDVATCGIAVAVASGKPAPAIATEAALREALLGSASIGFSTGPSGAHLRRLLERWGLVQALEPRLVQAPPGVPVASLVASGRAAIGFQQASEFLGAPGIRVLGPLPASVQLDTTFKGGVGVSARQAGAAREWLAFLASPDASEAKRRHGMR